MKWQLPEDWPQFNEKEAAEFQALDPKDPNYDLCVAIMRSEAGMRLTREAAEANAPLDERSAMGERVNKLMVKAIRLVRGRP
jgi:hypothetical protein